MSEGLDQPAGTAKLPARQAAGGLVLPALFCPNESASRRFIEFFTANIRNPNTRRAYGRAVVGFAAWCEQEAQITVLRDIEPVHVAAYVETLQTRLSAPSVKQHLAAIRMLFDWLVVGQVVAINPASAVRGPKHSVKKGKTPVLAADEARALLDAIDVSTAVGLRDRALIGLMVYTFARIGAALKMRIEDVYVQGRRSWVRLHEKGGKRHEMPCHHNLEEYLHAYIEGAQLAGAGKAFLFRTAIGHTGRLSERPMSQADAYRMIGRRAADAGILTRIGNHSFRATGITEYLRNGGKLEIAQQMANHESARTTGLYDRRNDQLTLDEVERIVV
ncbi:tyrosine-type recombinase/integrase [Aromatoleum buckelii]|uniref:tyrosine-type recombinase/integrase n=1 Tax=Aromatoleum buckelii TaxID=200254 RepID=UPI001FF52E25|nr:tyrosine-type recombinase/integrase [Aromatoleum buckelii]MCK0509557.1 site-specific integrase [Aromatoleum buckelii]